MSFLSTTRQKCEQARASDACGQEVRTDSCTRESHPENLSTPVIDFSKSVHRDSHKPDATGFEDGSEGTARSGSGLASAASSATRESDQVTSSSLGPGLALRGSLLHPSFGELRRSESSSPVENSFPRPPSVARRAREPTLYFTVFAGLFGPSLSLSPSIPRGRYAICVILLPGRGPLCGSVHPGRSKLPEIEGTS